jgi:hypothetical protein
MDVFGHENEGVNLKSAFAAISVKSFQEEADIVFDNEKSSALPSRERHEVSPGGEIRCPGFKSKPQQLKAGIFAYPKSARVELVPFPVKFVEWVFRFGKGVGNIFVGLTMRSVSRVCECRLNREGHDLQSC